MRTIGMLSGAALAAGAIISTADAGVVMIDDFTTGPESFTISGGDLVTQQAGAMLGGQRDLGAAIGNNPFGQNLDVMIDNLGLGFSSSSGPGLESWVSLDYDGNDVETGNFPFVQGPGLGSLDWSGLDAFEIDFLHLDLSMSVKIVLQSFDNGGSLIGEMSLEQVVSPGTNFVESFAFGDFSVDSGTPSFSDVDRVIYTFNSTMNPSVDFIVTSLGVVPTPGALALFSLAGLGARRRRRA